MGRVKCQNCGAIYDSPGNVTLEQLNAWYQCARCGAQAFVPLAAPPAPPTSTAKPVVGAAAGAALGGALAGPAGAIIGGFLGLIIGSKA